MDGIEIGKYEGYLKVELILESRICISKYNLFCLFW